MTKLDDQSDATIKNVILPSNCGISELEQWTWKDDAGAPVLGEEKIPRVAVSELPRASGFTVQAHPAERRPFTATFSVTESVDISSRPLTPPPARLTDRPTVLRRSDLSSFGTSTARFTRRRLLISGAWQLLLCHLLQRHGSGRREFFQGSQ